MYVNKKVERTFNLCILLYNERKIPWKRKSQNERTSRINGFPQKHTLIMRLKYIIDHGPHRDSDGKNKKSNTKLFILTFGQN